MSVYLLLNLFVAFLPITLLFLILYIPNQGGNVAGNNYQVGKYYTGDSANSLFYNISQNDQRQVDELWTSGASEKKMKDFFTQISKNTSIANNRNVRCGFRWEARGAEIGAYCYDKDTNTKTTYATPPVVSYLSSQFETASTLQRVAFHQKIISDSKIEYKMRLNNKEYLAVPVETVDRVRIIADKLTYVECLVEDKVFKQAVGGWALVDLNTKASSLTPEKISSVIRFQVMSGALKSSRGSLFMSVTSYTSVAQYCDIVKKGKLMVGWGGNFFSYGEKHGGFIWKYWPLLLMYVVSLSLTGGVYGRNMFVGYDAFIRTGVANQVAIQVFVFNERLYHTFYNMVDYNHDIEMSRLLFEMVLLCMTALIFEAFIIKVITKSIVGKIYTKYETKLFLFSLFFVITALSIQAGLATNAGVNRECESGITKCFFYSNSTPNFIITHLVTFLVQALLLNTFVINKIAAGKSRLSVAPSGIESDISSFERHCMSKKTPKDEFDCEIYKSNSKKKICNLRFIRFHGFTCVNELGLVRTKDLWMIFLSVVLPRNILKNCPVSLIIWKVQSSEDVLAPKRVFWEDIGLDEVKAVY